ncbi:hypothetical protein [Aquitalea sp. USM4]|uniref:hypothetical protein n=1 Tax=Aquitalea sp. USM4 TaxID=1590041 RepID=UPI00103AC934|nr:hypothetical protein [Aquitalea sp. USM4]QBJ80508.1 hypothetical protein DKK66_19865 [Aquitalea sp. USM4]
MSFFDMFTPGGDPFATRVLIGDIELTGLEVPESITPAGTQQVVIHRLIGGKKTGDVMGVDYENPSWSGWITGADAGSRVAALEKMRDTGDPVTFTFDTYSFKVLLHKFAPTFEHVYRRHYTIELIVLERLDAPNAVNSLLGSLDALINSDVGKALDLAGSINITAVSDAITAVQSAVSNVQNIANATVQTVQTIVRPIVAAQQIIQSTIDQVAAAVNDITTLGGVIPGNPVSKAAANVLRQVQSATQLSYLYQLQSVLGRLQKNVLAGPLANGTSSVTTGNTNLQQLAATAYGDQSKWTDIAAANGLTDPVLTGIQTVTIPKGT